MKLWLTRPIRISALAGNMSATTSATLESITTVETFLFAMATCASVLGFVFPSGGGKWIMIRRMHTRGEP